MKNIALIMAGGSGNRMESSIPKQFLKLNGKPILMHTIERFLYFDDTMEIIVVLPQSQIKTWKNLCSEHAFTVKHQLTTGGSNRFNSVKNGLQLIQNEVGLVAIHDGVRPFVSVKTLERCMATALEKGNAIPVIKPYESVRQIKGNQNIAVNRDEYALVQTPQTFDIQTIVQAYNQPFSSTFTDDASVLESTGKPIFLVEGNRENIKITEPLDLILAHAIDSL